MSQFKAVIFDMDGVLIDARDWHYRALNEALGLFGTTITYDEHLTRFDGLPTRIKLRMLSEEGRLPSLLHKVVEEVKQERTLREAARHCFPSIDHLLMFAWIREQGVKVGVATNSIRESSETMLAFAGLLPSLDCLVTNQDVQHGKPAPDIYLEACRRLEVTPSSVLVVEDHEFGVKAAKAAGCAVVKVEDVSDVNTSLLDPYFEPSGA